MNTIPTVLGPITPDQLGHTLCHEHLLFTIAAAYRTVPPGVFQQRKARQVVLSERSSMASDPFSTLDNLFIDDPDLAADELFEYRVAGGNTILEVTSIDMGRDPRGLARVAAKTGVNIICGTGYYLSSGHPPEVHESTVAQLAERMLRDLVDGIDGTRIRAGVIGEIGTSTPIHPDELKVMQAAAVAQRETGRPLVIHPGAGYDQPYEVAAKLKEFGADLGRVVMSHIDERFRDSLDGYAKLAEMGPMLSMDTFGREVYFPMRHRQHPNDETRIRALKGLIDRGLANRIVVAQDIGFKTDLRRFGGHGYSHFIDTLWPRLAHEGITEEHLRQILVENPKTLFGG